MMDKLRTPQAEKELYCCRVSEAESSSASDERAASCRMHRYHVPKVRESADGESKEDNHAAARMHSLLFIIIITAKYLYCMLA